MDGSETKTKNEGIISIEVVAEENAITVTTPEAKKLIKWEKYKKPLSNVGFWLCFGVIIGLTPALSSLLVSGAVKQQFTLEKTFGHGELLAISIALMGEAMGYLLTNPKVNSGFKSIVGFGCTLTLLSSAFLLGVLTIEKLTFDTTYIMHVSFFLFALTLIVGSFCKWTER